MQLDSQQINEIRTRLEHINRIIDKLHKKRTFGKNPLLTSMQTLVAEVIGIITEDCPNYDKETKTCKIFKETCEIIVKKECAYSKDLINEDKPI